MSAVHIHTADHDGVWNMAFDRLLMELVGGGRWDFVLRTYGWTPPCVSIGKLQKVHREVDAERLTNDGYGLVRRPTGGRAVWHETEVTYSIVAPERHPAVSGPMREALRKTSTPMLEAIRSLGVPAVANPSENHRAGGPRMSANPCFTSHGLWEIGTGDGRKLVGSAQARSRGVFLEHGSILLGNDQWKILDYMPEGTPPALLEMLGGHLTHGIACLEEFLPGVSSSSVVPALVQSFSRSLKEPVLQEEWRSLQGPRLNLLLKECADDL
ncbi:MAG: hypothetical protein AVO35_04095 [Candidatus Aegiribacteria sp. MLS_C]|nr:MAG: hypothetical protein AVO35_04095 [Candidatus Aegiribacteria sp. MLS_C]